MSMDALLVVGSAPRCWGLPKVTEYRRIACLRLAMIASVFVSAGATYSTPNFVVTAPTPEFAKQVGDLAEVYRDEIALEWLGKKLPRWFKPCPISVKVGQIGAGGATSFCFDRGEVFGWKMNIQGSEERILDSVLPHEVSHTIFACHFRRPLPRWADEGAATLVEHESERNRQSMLLNQVINTNRRIPLRQLLGMKEYPKEMQQVLTLYAEGYSLASFLVQIGGKTRYLNFLEDAHNKGWDEAILRHYSIKDVATLEGQWTQWIVAGSPPLARRDGTQLASNDRARSKPNDAVFRSQSPDETENDEYASRQANPESRSRTPRTDSRPADAAKSKGTGSGWVVVPEQQRLPRPTPLVSRNSSGVPNRSAAGLAANPEERREPVFVDEDEASPRTSGKATIAEPKFAEESADVSFRREDARAIPAPGEVEASGQPDFLEVSSVANSGATNWSAFPQADRTSRTARRVASAILGLSP